MIPSQKLIDALRQSADDILNKNKIYMWSSSANCNCGILVQNLLGLRTDYIQNDIMGSWTSNAKVKCPTTGLYVSNIVDFLVNVYGFTQNDFALIEFAGQPIPERASPNYDSYSNPEFVANFINDLANQLERDLRIKEFQSVKPAQVSVQTQSVYHG